MTTDIRASDLVSPEAEETTSVRVASTPDLTRSPFTTHPLSMGARSRLWSTPPTEEDSLNIHPSIEDTLSELRRVQAGVITTSQTSPTLYAPKTPPINKDVMTVFISLLGVQERFILRNKDPVEAAERIMELLEGDRMVAERIKAGVQSYLEMLRGIS